MSVNERSLKTLDTITTLFVSNKLLARYRQYVENKVTLLVFTAQLLSYVMHYSYVKVKT